MKRLVLLLTLTFLASCSARGPVPAAAEETETDTGFPDIDCTAKAYLIRSEKTGSEFRVPRKGRTGTFPVESHLMTAPELGEDKDWPDSKTEGIAEHITASCNLLKKRYGLKQEVCDAIYKNSWERAWTPAEGGGQIGQGSRGVPPNRLSEMFSFNMRWKPTVPKGTKFLLVAGDKRVVVVGGYEFGPGEKIIKKGAIGGVQPEVEYFLGISNGLPATVYYLKDQSATLGPVECKKDERTEKEIEEDGKPLTIVIKADDDKDKDNKDEKTQN